MPSLTARLGAVGGRGLAPPAGDLGNAAHREVAGRPDVAETGIDIDVSAPYGLAGPKGMDPTVVASLHDAFRKGMAEPSYLATLAQLDQQPVYLNSRDYRAFVMLELDEQKRVAHAIGLTGR